ncbi:MAG: hypothetical protein WAJ92_07540, partial [Candidatus Acidiferrales bacterium]
GSHTPLRTVNDKKNRLPTIRANTGEQISGPYFLTFGIETRMTFHFGVRQSGDLCELPVHGKQDVRAGSHTGPPSKRCDLFLSWQPWPRQELQNELS